MSVSQLLSHLPAPSKDLKLNLKAALADESLTPAQAWGTALAVAYVSGEPRSLEALAAEATERLGEAVCQAVEGVSAVMTQNNVYYRFTHLVGDDAYAQLPARLRMNALRPAGVEPVDVELWSLAVSAVNGCGLCIDSHEKALRKAGVSTAVIQACVRLAAIVHAVAGSVRARSVLQAT